MKKFVLHYSSSPEAMEAMAQATPEHKMAAMQPWLAWKESMGDKLVDFGAPMMGVQSLSADGSTSNNESGVTGYSIIQANDLEEAKSLLKNHPYMRTDGAYPPNPIQIFECIQMS